jgi:serine/threonine-protein kinase
VNFLCPACRTPLPTAAPAVVACSQCGVEVDLTRVDTAPGQAKLWPEVDLSGETLGNFKLISRAGSGGMGTVYVAEGLAGRCAVKVLSPQMAADPQLRERFRREAQALRQVLHKGIVRIIDEGAQNGFCWYAMEHVDGPDLRSRIAQGPLPPADVETLARELLDALGAVHDAQLVHRDLKPANILLSPGGARLCDFGIARFDGATTLTESAALLGSLRYMAPEQRAGQTSPKSDLYALGLVLHEALAKGLPGEVELPASTPRRLKRLIEALLQSAPRLRPESAHTAAQMIALSKPARVPAAVLVSASVLGVAAFAAWTVAGTQVRPPAPQVTRAKPQPPKPPPAKPQQPELVALNEAAPAAGLDAGAVAQAAVDAGATPVIAQAAPTGVPRTELLGFQAKGGLNEAAVSDVLSRHRAELASCYEQQLEENPGLAGDLSVRFSVGVPGEKGRTPPVLRAVLRGSPALIKGKGKKPSKVVEPSEEPPKKEKIAEDPGAPEQQPPEAPPTKAPEPKPAAPAKPALVFGLVGDVTVAKATLENKAAITCMLKRIASWRFPAGRGATLVAATWTFSPTGGEAPPLQATKPKRANTINTLSSGRGTGTPTKN